MCPLNGRRLKEGLVRDGGEGQRGRCGALAAVEFADDAGDVGAGFAEGWDAVVLVDGAGAGVVGGEREGEVVLVALEERVEVGGAAVDVLAGLEAVGDAE